jgi:flagellar biosynthesis protein FlhF
MNVMRFVGRTSGEAMRKLRDALGPDALVLANRPCAEGVELLAAAPGTIRELESGVPREAPRPRARAAAPRAPLSPPQAEERAAEDRAAPQAVPAGMSTVSFQDYVRQRLRERSQGGARKEDPAAAPATRPAFAEPPAAVADPVTAPVTDRRATAEVRPVRPAATVRREPTLDGPDMPAGFADGWGRPDAASTDTARAALPAGRGLPDAPARATPAPAASDALVAELQSLKGMISRQFATISWFEGVRRSPVQGKLLRTMVAAGFSLKLARSVVTRLPSDYSERDAQVWLEAVLARNLRCATPAQSFEAGGVFALVGPTGVGKTTTTAKIAARHVLRHGPQSVALITVDTYRLGAHDQLRAFGRILGVPVHIAHDASALHDLLRLRGSRQLVLIDTVGMGHRDERIRSLLMSLPRTDIKHVVVASCAAQAESIDESLRAYEARQAHGVVLTKLDEAARSGGALDCLLRQRLQLLGVCDGQRVPEDWQAADAGKLVRRALLSSPASAFALDDEELPLVFGVAATLQGEASHA